MLCLVWVMASNQEFTIFMHLVHWTSPVLSDTVYASKSSPPNPYLSLWIYSESYSMNSFPPKSPMSCFGPEPVSVVCTDLSHVGDEEGQPGAEEEPQQDSQSETGLQCPPPLPVSQTTLTVHWQLWMIGHTWQSVKTLSQSSRWIHYRLWRY